MTTWTKEQVSRVKGLRVAMDFDPAIFARTTEKQATADLLSLLTPRLIDMGHTLGVEIHPEDCAINLVEAEHRWDRRVICAWSPRTDAVELRGGQEDGRVYAIRKVGDPLRVPIIAQTPWVIDASSAEASLVEMTLTYEFTGEWSEDRRRWIYALR